ncbi:hypothetical protein [Solirubrobacter ginsenosidimutans]|uniref:hypothetical protein n=1 Tax=Solirubrobacter ginsenosidimutans TaxID=490573 RepID=UPI0022CE12F8|nr:hypothetical protein [Solirubrobacter ginsenosidimutans]
MDAAGYLAVADRLQRRLEPLWDARLGRYEPGPGATDTEVNADLLLVHSVAALQGHDGPTRADARARSIARFLVSPAVWTDRPPLGADPQVTGPGWVAMPGRPNRHLVFDVEAIDGLVHAYLARDVLRLDGRTVARIRDEIHRVATSSDWRWPALRLNQINWYCAVLAADAVVNANTSALAGGMGRYVARFLAGAAPQGAKAGNLGPGLRFHYLPDRGLRTRSNVDSAEYANIVLGFSRYYGLARDSGMAAPAQLDLLHEWVRRVLAGYWTHSGYLNWDTGLGFSRWHQRKKSALSQLALIGVASSPELQPTAAWGAWAKWMLDRGLTGYVAQVEREHGIPAALAYGVNVVPQSRANAYLAAARYESNAARALEAGIGRRSAIRPPALYSFDPDTGRLAVTTAAYNTAIVPVNQRAIPYGGIDIARLFDARQDVAANIGGSGAASFGLTARVGGRVALRTQYGDRGFNAGATPLRLTRAPRGAGVSGTDTSRRAYAGPFTDLRASGEVHDHGIRATTHYRFTPGWIEARWTLRAATDVDPVTTFPSWGSRAHVVATLRDGRIVTLGAGTRPLASVRSLHIVSEHSGYQVLPLARPAGALIRLVTPAPQPADPHPGPTVEIVLATGRTASFAARIIIDAPPA